ncbi:MAG: CotH kinase family protein [Clostridia bacterium]|nr:CotH kinase family protein [Clostridia bacterium]
MKRFLLILFLCLLVSLLMGCRGGDPSGGETLSESGSTATDIPTDTLPQADTLPDTAEPETHPPVELPFDCPTDELPVISIQTNGIPVDSKDYVDMTLTLANTAEPLAEVGGSIRLRGNSTYEFPKKPYRIRLDQKHSFFGLDKAKSWVLLADWLDPSALHNYAALTLAGTSDSFDFVPTPHKVNLYLNGEYQGLYTLCEQVQEQEGRLDLEFTPRPSMKEIEDFNFLICMNHNAPEKPGAEEGVTYFYLSACDRYFELEYPRREDFPSETLFRRFFTAMEDYMRETVIAFMGSDRAYLTKNVDTDTLIDFFIVDQIMGDRDHHWKSVFLYYRGADEDPMLHFGPPWDYDFCMFTEWTGEPNREFDISNDFNPAEASVFFRPLLENSYFSRKVRTRYKNHFSEAITQVIQQTEACAAAMPESLRLNQDAWYGDEPTLTEENLSFFIRYLKARKAILDKRWT